MGQGYVDVWYKEHVQKERLKDGGYVKCYFFIYEDDIYVERLIKLIDILFL